MIMHHMVQAQHNTCMCLVCYGYKLFGKCGKSGDTKMLVYYNDRPDGEFTQITK